MVYIIGQREVSAEPTVNLLALLMVRRKFSQSPDWSPERVQRRSEDWAAWSFRYRSSVPIRLPAMWYQKLMQLPASEVGPMVREEMRPTSVP